MRWALARSEVKTWVASTTIPIPVRFLEAYLSRFSNPVIHEFRIRQVLLTTTAASNTFAGRDQSGALTQIRIADRSGDRVNMRGQCTRIMMQQEFGGSYRDPANIAPSQSNARRVLNYRIPFNFIQRSKRKSDFGIPLAEFLDGGVIELTTNDATPNDVTNNIGTIQSGTYTVYVKIVDELEPEAKSRVVWKDFLFQQQEDTYATPGLLRSFSLYAGEIGVQNARTLVGASGQKITSNTVDLSQIDDDVLRDMQLDAVPDHSLGDPAAVVTSTNEVQLGNVIPVIIPGKDSKLTEMPFVKSFHCQVDFAVPTSTDLPRAICCFVVPRTDANLEAAFGGSAGQIKDGLSKVGYVKTANGKPSPLSNWPGHLQTLMPIKGATDQGTLGWRNALVHRGLK